MLPSHQREQYTEVFTVTGHVHQPVTVCSSTWVGGWALSASISSHFLSGWKLSILDESGTRVFFCSPRSSKEVEQGDSDQGQDFNEEKNHLSSLNSLILNSKVRHQLSSLKILNEFSTVQCVCVCVLIKCLSMITCYLGAEYIQIKHH